MLLKKKVRDVVVTKFLSVLITVSLVLTSLSSLATAAPMPSAVIPTMMVQQGQINTNIIPFNVGRVTETLYNGKGRVLVTIQDLHSHRQTQENINSILKILDSKYGIKNIWLEGASGTLDTSWLTNISDKKIKEQAIETLLSKGKLTGAELFSVQTNRPTIIRGLENKDVYLTNFERLYEIYNNRNEIAAYLPKIKAILNAKTAQYYSIENKKINALQEKNKKGDIKADKYFAHIIRAANRAGIALSNYDQIAKYVFIMGKQKDINFRKVNEQISEIINKLKETLIYQQYKSLIEKVNNKETETEFYTTIKQLAEENEILGKYKEAVKFFDYIQYNEILNPILLAEQEEELINDIETSFARTGYEKDVLFLKKYFRLIENYLNNKITADQYRYFKNNEIKFKNLWVKYVDVDGIIDIEKYFGLFNDFYNDNVERNRYFIENVIGTKPAKEKDAVVIKASDMYNSQAIEELTKEKDGIDVVITGGFHTRGLSRLFEEEKINYLVITPNVTDETLTSEKLYENMFREEYAVVSEKFANMPISEVIKNVVAKVGDIEDIKVSDTMIQFLGKEGTVLSVYKFVDGTAVTSVNEDGSTNYMSQNNIKGTVTINGEEVDVAENEKINQQQAEIVAKAFLDLQEYLKTVRENERRQRAGKDLKDTSLLRNNVIDGIAQITDESLKDAFTEKLNQNKDALSSETLLQAKGTVKVLNRIQAFLEGIGIRFQGTKYIYYREDYFRHTFIGVILGAAMEPFISFLGVVAPKKLIEMHPNWRSDKAKKIGVTDARIIAGLDICVLAASIAFMHSVIPTIAAFVLADIVFHSVRNLYSGTIGRHLLQAGSDKVNGIEILKNLIGKNILCFNVENPDDQSLEYSQYEGMLKIEAVNDDKIDIVRIEDGNEIHLLDQQVVEVTRESDGEIVIEILNKYTDGKDTLKLHVREYAEASAEKAVSVEVETGMKYERGEIKNDVVESPMRPTEQSDVFDPTKLTMSEQLALERKGIEALLAGKVSLSMLIAGASSRMNVNEAPQAIKDVVASGKTGTGGTMGSKAAVPITADGITYLEAFLLNITRLQEQIKQLAEKYGVDASKLTENEILLMTNEDYRAEHEAMLRNYYGTQNIPEKVRLFEQPLGAKYIANLSDTRKMKSKFENPEDYYKALWYSAQIALASKENPEVILSQERDPLGHGEYFHQLIESGELMHLIMSGKQYIYVKNVDNYAAKFDRTFLIELGYFVRQSEEKGINFLSEVSQRVPGLKGGSWFVDNTSGSQFAVEDPTLNATIAYAKEKAETATTMGDIKQWGSYASQISVPSFGFNDAVAFYTPEYVANLYLQEGQTLEQFIVEYDEALKEKAKGNLKPIQQIAQRGRSKFPQLLDPKPGKKFVTGQQVPADLSIYEGILTAEEIAAISAFAGTTVDVKPVVAKIETNMWQSTAPTISALNKVATILTKNGRNIDIVAYQNLSWEEKVAILSLWRFAATKQWDKTDADKEKIRQDLNKTLNLKEGDKDYIAMIDDPRILIVCESYNAYEKLGVAEDLIRYIRTGQLVDEEVLEPAKPEKPVSVEVKTGMKYWAGEIKNDVVERPMRPTEQSDVFNPMTLSQERQLKLERKGAEALLAGSVSLSILMGGASSRMSVAEAPEEIKDVVASGKTGVKTMGSKAAVPITADGTTYFGIFMTNIVKLFEQLRAQAGKRALYNNDVLLMTNEEYAPEHQNMLDNNGYYGFENRANVKLFKQPLGSTYIANMKDTRSMRSKFENPEDYYKALWYAADTMVRARENPEALLSQEKAPLGHGEYFHQLIESGELLGMFESGKKYVYVKNIDNYAAKFDKTFLIELGYFIEQAEANGINFMSEVSQRVAGLKGGSWFVDNTSGSQFAVEDPTLNATIAYAEEKAETATTMGDTKQWGDYAKQLFVPSFGFNDAVAFYRPEYVANLYLLDGQTIEEFMEEYRAALKEKEKGNLTPIQEIAQRGRSRFPQLLDPKPGKKFVTGQQVPADLSIYEGILTAEEIAAISAFAGTTVDVKPVVAKIETNMWQSTGISALNKITTTLVKNGRNIDIMDYQNLSWEEKVSLVLLWWRFAATKQWDKTDADKEKIRQDLNKVAGLKEGDEGYIATIDDPRVLIVCESYNAYEKLGVAEDIIKYITEEQLIDNLGFEFEKSSIAQPIQNFIKAANEWLQIKILEIASLFKVKAEVIAVVDASDAAAIAEAKALAESGIKVKMILLNYNSEAVTDETGNIIYNDRNEALFELAQTRGPLNVITYEAYAGKDIADKDAIKGILDDIKAGNLVGQSNKNVLYITPSLLEGQEDITDEYIDDKSVLAVSTSSLRGAIAKGLLNYNNTRVQALKDMIIQPANIFGTYKANEVTFDAIKGLKEKGIDNIMIEVTSEIDNAISLAKANGMNIVVFGEGAENIKAEGVTVAVSENPAKNQRQVVNYNQAITMKGDLSNVIVNISREERENIVLTSDNIKALINMGAAVAFDGVVLRELSKDNTAENGITMFDIIKAMFADTPEQKAAKEKAKGIRIGRNLAVSNYNFSEEDIKKILLCLKNISNEKEDLHYVRSNIYKLEGISIYDNLINSWKLGRNDVNEIIGVLEGSLQVYELKKVFSDIQDTDRIDNMNELMARLVEYRLLTGKSYNPNEGAEVIKTLSDKTPDEIMKELQSMLQKEDLADSDKAYVLNGIIELLLAENLQLDRDMSEMLEINTNKLHALLSAA